MFYSIDFEDFGLDIGDDLTGAKQLCKTESVLLIHFNMILNILFI